MSQLDAFWISLRRYRWLFWLTALLPLGVLLVLLAQWPSMPEPRASVTPQLDIPRVPAIAPALFGTIKPKTAEQKVRRSVHDFYRFAGPIMYETGNGEPRYKAFLHDIKNDRQYIVEIGETHKNELKVTEIQSDLLTVEFEGETQHLEMRFLPSRDEEGIVGAATNNNGRAIRFWERPALEQNRFGKRIDTNRWVLSRDALMNHYQDIIQKPEELLNLFDSFATQRDENRKTTGYKLEFKGDQTFLGDMGLLEGDEVKKVNSMAMTSQRRAEWFIAEFVRGNMEAIVLDVERDGELIPIVYLVR